MSNRESTGIKTGASTGTSAGISTAKIRKIAGFLDETHREMGQLVQPPTRRAAAVAVIENPYAGRFVRDLELLMVIGEEMGALLGRRCVDLLGIEPSQAQSYGKAAMVGEQGELEHAAAVLHPRLGKPLRSAVDSGAALVASSKKMGSMGQVLDIPLGHKQAAYVRSHFDAMQVCVSDAPRANEILVAVAVTDSGRPLPRVGGLAHDEVQGHDGLR